MARYIYSTKRCSNEFAVTGPPFSKISVNKPHYCPICLSPQEGSRIDSKLWAACEGLHYGTVMYQCNSCGKKYLATYDIDTKHEKGTFKAFYPVLAVTYEDDLLQPVSPRFVDLYGQALRAEATGDIDIAATGYRNALECLVKDYAISELHEDRETVERKSLYDAIEAYLDEALIKTADVVRILGNDYTHYKQKYRDIDFENLKSYMEIFISLVQTKVRINHPPVSR